MKNTAALVFSLSLAGGTLVAQDAHGQITPLQRSGRHSGKGTLDDHGGVPARRVGHGA